MRICSYICVIKLTWQERVKQKKKEVTKCYKRMCTSKHNANYKYTTYIPRKHYTIMLKLGQWNIKLQQNMCDKYGAFRSATEKQTHADSKTT